jgi:hypothetical protein
MGNYLLRPSGRSARCPCLVHARPRRRRPLHSRRRRAHVHLNKQGLKRKPSDPRPGVWDLAEIRMCRSFNRGQHGAGSRRRRFASPAQPLMRDGMSAYEQDVALAELAASSEPKPVRPGVGDEVAECAGPPTRRAAATSSRAASRSRPWTADQLSQACTTVSRVILPSVSSQIPDASTRVPSSYWQAT